MSWHEYVRRALAAAAPTGEIDEDVVEELAQHAEAARETARADGLDEERAEAHVRGLVDAWCAALGDATRRPRRPPLVEPPAVTSALPNPIVPEIGMRVCLIALTRRLRSSFVRPAALRSRGRDARSKIASPSRRGRCSGRIAASNFLP